MPCGGLSSDDNSWSNASDLQLRVFERRDSKPLQRFFGARGALVGTRCATNGSKSAAL